MADRSTMCAKYRLAGVLAVAAGMVLAGGGCAVEMHSTHRPHHGPPPRSVTIACLPGPYAAVSVDGVLFYISGGVYYRRVSGGYIVVDPPVVRALPHGHETVIIDGRTYFRRGGTYYARHGGHYTVVAPPRPRDHRPGPGRRPDEHGGRPDGSGPRDDHRDRRDDHQDRRDDGPQHGRDDHRDRPDDDRRGH